MAKAVSACRTKWADCAREHSGSRNCAIATAGADLHYDRPCRGRADESFGPYLKYHGFCTQEPPVPGVHDIRTHLSSNPGDHRGKTCDLVELGWGGASVTCAACST